MRGQGAGDELDAFAVSEDLPCGIRLGVAALGMDHNALEAQPTYVGIKNQAGELAVGTDHKEALWRAKYLGFDRSPGAEPEWSEVSAQQYRAWWNQRSDQERADMLQGGGSQPPAES